MRRRAGVGAIHKQKLEQERYKDKGTELQERELDQMTKQLEVFRVNLEEFAANHKNEIKKNATFRRQFQEMCAAIGVDPLASNKGFWSVLNIGDFYYELSVQIVEVCLATSSKNGGLIGLDELREKLLISRGRAQEVTNEDILCAAKKLNMFGNGFKILPVGGGRYVVQSVPGEMSMDQTSVLSSVSNNANVSLSYLISQLNWTKPRAEKALQGLVTEGLAWVDTQDSKETLYWFPSFFTGCINS
ncbi:vacuolar-sorting protein SNF8 [Cimex lectularius]|uniref:Vacuolar-sorting protein SNF8 n=1 Tax=Cimex lectularius TaxID=79782 RepID=A0A8I6SGX6_CIMLE|nr:vacuolar-sorting protein SNF8 [Cimex lectularius]